MRNSMAWSRSRRKGIVMAALLAIAGILAFGASPAVEGQTGHPARPKPKATTKPTAHDADSESRTSESSRHRIRHDSHVQLLPH